MTRTSITVLPDDRSSVNPSTPRQRALYMFARKGDPDERDKGVAQHR